MSALVRRVFRPIGTFYAMVSELNEKIQESERKKQKNVKRCDSKHVT